MKTTRCRESRPPAAWMWVAGLCALALALTLPLPSAAAEGQICKVSDRKSVAEKFGDHPLVRGGTESREALAALFEGQTGGEIACVLEAHGLSHLANALTDAAAGGGVTERDLDKDECFQWMMWRPNGNGLARSNPICLKTRQLYRSYDVAVDEVISETKANPQCKLAAQGDVASRQIRVDSTGSSSGATVAWSSSSGASGDLSGGPAWQVPWNDLCTTDYTFTVSASEQGSKQVATHHFVVPQICANLAYSGRGEPRTIEGKTETCEAKVVVERHQPNPPAVELTVDPTSVRTRQPVNVAASFESVCLKSEGVEVQDAQGNPLSGFDLSGLPTSIRFRKPGTYKIVATAEDATGQQGMDMEMVRVHPRWTARGFFAFIDPTDDQITTSQMTAPGISERTGFSLDKGTGFGAGLEYRFSERVGLEGSILLGQVDSNFILDINDDWGMNDENLDMTVFSLGPNFHLLRDSRVDLYIGPFLALVQMDDAAYNVLGRRVRVELDDGTALGAQLGLDIPFRPNHQWGFNATLRYMDLSVDADQGVFGTQELDVSPIVATAGLSYSF